MELCVEMSPPEPLRSEGERGGGVGPPLVEEGGGSVLVVKHDQPCSGVGWEAHCWGLQSSDERKAGECCHII